MIYLNNSGISFVAIVLRKLLIFYLQVDIF